MNHFSTYPPDIAATLHRRWHNQALPPQRLPDLARTTLLIDTMYQASLLREESEPIQCRIIYASPDDFADELADGGNPLQVLRFTERCDLTPHQLRKLAAAAGYYRALLAVDFLPDGQPHIWGMVVTGTEWVNRIEADQGGDSILPSRLVIHCVGPGHLIATSGYTRVLESSGGRLLMEGFDPFRSQWLPKRFGSVRASLIDLIHARDDDPASPAVKMCDSFVRDVAQSVVRRTLRLVRTRGHGGMLLYLPDGMDRDQKLDQWLRFRVRFQDDDSTLRFRRVMLALMKRAREVGGAAGLAIVRYTDYLKMRDSELTRLEEQLIEFGHLLADLMSVDGALVMDRRFRLVGFGGEILGDAHVIKIHRALDVESQHWIAERADSSGTRHRSAYRFVNGLPEAIAVVVSQDGDVRFVAHHDNRLTYWPYLP